MTTMSHKQENKVKRLAVLWPCFLCILVLAGCQTSRPVDRWQPVQNQQATLVHTITWEKENLALIARWYTGAQENWQEIANANPDIIAGQLRPGDRIFIPPRLIETRAPLTKGFVDEWLRTAAQRGSPAAGQVDTAAPLLVPGLHKRPQDSATPGRQPAPPDVDEPDDENDLELFGPR
ncbi:MAG: hypothetical protein C0613_02405 [Desulfobulbaceae bacterium]|nr:MAG: hypothetical protein C0613_02405 [Desulfobulbaceae bacterium]